MKMKNPKDELAQGRTDLRSHDKGCVHHYANRML